jgi:Ca2+-binding EF-hand superfamily protein
MSFNDLPEKFHSLDIDTDAYLSFDELLKAIDDFFDYRSELNTEEVYRMINFFFAQ